jgi:hypothetical protein
MARQWTDNFGQDGMFYNLPFQTTAVWDRTSSQIPILRQGSGHIHQGNDFAPPIYRNSASDPLITCTASNGKTVQCHIPVGATTELPVTGTDNGFAVIDTVNPYRLISFNIAQILPNGVIQASGSSVTCSNMEIDDGAGLIWLDQVTGQPGQGNCFGALQDWELTAARLDPNFQLGHMIQVELDPSQMSRQGPIWPLLVIDTSFPNNGALPQGQTYGIPANVPMPSSITTRAGKFLWDIFQRFGGFYYNVSGNGTMSIQTFPIDPANVTFVNQMAAAFPAVLAEMSILANQTGLSSMKGMVNGIRSDAFPAPDLLDLSPSSGVELLPSSFGAYYPSGYNVTPTAPTPPVGPPNGATSLHVISFTDTTVTLGWTNPTSGSVPQNIWIDDKTATGAFTQVGSVPYPATQFTVTGLTPSTVYQFEVFEENLAGVSAASNVVSQTTAAPAVTKAQIQAQVVSLEGIVGSLSSALTSISTNVGLLP